jgi:glycosyltransferase involved in cell wall biosynthesis
MKIAFHDNSLSLRGTTVAIYDWAYWTRHYLGVDPIIMYDTKHPANSGDVIEKFKKEFPVFGYDKKSQIDEILSKNNCNAFLMEKGGKPDGVISTVSKNLVNAISVCSVSDIHGDVYAMGSKWLSKITNYEIPYVPYMVDLPDINEDMREELGIPKDALVIGRNGGSDTFDIPFVKQAIQVVLNERKDIWFIFQLTDKFIDHERVIFLPGSSDMNTKVRFINTSDAMLHARYVGESFGLSCAEFSIRNKPVITYEKSPERNHIDTLGEKGIYYENYSEILHILRNLDKKEINSLEWNCYQDYTPEKVVQKFKEVYL